MSELAMILAAKEAGALDSVELQNYVRSSLEKAFPDFDVEKVFWRILWTEGIILSGKVVYEIYKWIRLLSIGEIGIDWNLAFIWAPSLVTLWGAIWQNLFPGEEPTPEDLMELRKEKLAAIGIPLIIDQLFNEYFGYVLVAPVALFPLMEYRKYKRARARGKF